MKFDSANSILTEVRQMLMAQQVTAQNRTLIQRLFNGDTPYTECERRDQNLKTNVNFLDGTRIASNATNQLANAFTKGRRFFSVSVDKGPVRMRPHYGTIITNEINKELKRCRAYSDSLKSTFAQVVLHGAGPMVWKNRRSPCPTSLGIEDVLIPSGTLASMENMNYLSIYREMTWGELEDLVTGPAVDPGWNMPYIKALLATLYKTGLVPVYQGNRWLFPEKLQEDIKEGSSQMMSSSLPKVLCWEFFFLNDKTGKWNRRIILDYASVTADYSEAGDEPSSEGPFRSSDTVVRNKDFLYSKDDYADDHNEVIQWKIGNCSNHAPFRYYSIRSIGYLLYGACMIQNKLRCRSIDHIFQSLLTLFRNVSDDNREKVQMIDLQNFGVMPDGVTMVPAVERHMVDANLVLMALNQNRQTMAESSSSFIADMPGEGSGKEMTATETLVRQNASFTLTSAVQNQLSEQSTYEYREICRRFCISGNNDPMVKRVREKCRKLGVPDEVFDVDAWEVTSEQAVGGGNKAMEMTVTQVLMQEFLPNTDPEGQRIILRRRYEALTDNPEEAMVVVPEGPQPISDDAQYAQLAYSVLMDGVPFTLKEGVNHVVYTAMLLQLMQVTIQQVNGVAQHPSGIGMASEKLAGLVNVANHCEQEIAIIARDERRKDVAKQLFKALAEMKSAIEQLAKAVMAAEQEQQSQGGMDPQTIAKIQERQMMAQTNAEIAAQNAAMKREQKQISWAEENARRNATVEAENQRKLLQTVTDIRANDLKTAAEIRRELNQPTE